MPRRGKFADLLAKVRKKFGTFAYFQNYYYLCNWYRGRNPEPEMHTLIISHLPKRPRKSY